MTDISQTMPRELHEVYRVLDAELTATWQRHTMFQGLFGERALRVQLLNETAPVFFAHVQSLLRSDLLVRVARLVDKPYEGDKATIVLLSLPPLLDAAAKASIGVKVETILGRIEARAAPIVTVRHKTIAHCDKSIALGVRDDPSAELMYGDITAVMNLAGKLLNLVARHYGGPTVAYGHFIESVKGVPALVWRLKLAKHTEEQMQDDPSVSNLLRESRWWSA